MLGSCPRHQAGKATEARCDFKWRGGTLMISRRIRPWYTAASFADMSSKCQFAANGMRGLSSRKARAAKLAKSKCRRPAWVAPEAGKIYGWHKARVLLEMDSRVWQQASDFPKVAHFGSSGVNL